MRGDKINKAYNIGKVKLANCLIAAPLAGLSDYPLRQLCRDFGAGLTYSEMISSEGISRNNQKSKTFTFVKGEHPINVQIFGHDPDNMAYAAQYFEDLGADIIDINFGCPVPKVVKQGSCSALARNVKQSLNVINAVRKSLSIPLTIKLRLGWSKNEENYLEIAKQAEALGVDAICLHPRYATQLYTGNSDWSKLLALRNAVKVPVIGSGDVLSCADIEEKIAKYGADFIMIGRGMLGNPWVFSDYLKLEKKPLQETISRHFEYLCEYHGEAKSTRLFRKFISKYVKPLKNSKELRIMGNNLNSKTDLQKILELIDV